jgi:hypothetical protein
MTTDTKEKLPEKKLFSELRGKYNLLDGNKLYRFDFPVNATLEDNFAAISFIKDEVFKTISEKNKCDTVSPVEVKETSADIKPE